MEALSHYTDQGWVVHVFPWVVGIRGMIDSSHVESLLKFLGIQQRHWRVAIERTAIASVRAFHFLHKVRFGGPIRPDLDPDDNSNTSDDDVSVVTTKRKYRVHPTPEDSDSESQIEDSPLPDSQQLRRPRQLPDTQLVPGVSLSGTVSPPDAISSTTNRTPTTAQLTPTACGLALGNRTKPRVRARWKG